MDLNQWMVLLMFITFIVMLFRGIPVVYALVGASLLFVLVGEVVLDPSKKLINEYIEFKRTGISYIKLFTTVAVSSAVSSRTRFWWLCRCSSTWA